MSKAGQTQKAILPCALALAAALLCAGAMAAGMPAQQAHAASDKSVTKSVLKIAKKYDSDSYFLLNTMVKHGDNILAWWGDEWFVSAYDTMVHEECHAYSHLGAWNSEQIYVGGKKSVKVRLGKAFRSKKMASSVPKRLRSDRYAIYVAKPSKNLASDVHGAYGLLNEFMAYCWGDTAMLKMYAYCKAEEQQVPGMWLEYLSTANGSALAYAEFRYFIEHYAYYAKRHYPRVYSDLMANGGFKKALKKVDKRFNATVRGIDKRTAAIAKDMRKKGYYLYASESGSLMYLDPDGGGYGRGMHIDEYNVFAKALSAKRYKAIEKKLGLKPVAERKLDVMTQQQARQALEKANLSAA